MKKQLLAVFALLSASAGQAQTPITLTAATHMPQADTGYYMSFQDTSANPMMPAMGANLNWNYTNVLPTGPTTAEYFGCIPQANCANFGNPDLLSGSPADSTFQYFKTTTANKFQTTGLSSPFFTVNFNNLLDIYRYPLTYGTQYVDAATGSASSPAVSLPLTVTASDTVEGVGYGTVTTPTGTFNDVLLVRSSLRLTATAIIVTALDTNAVLYNWYEAGSRFPVMTMTYTYQISGGARVPANSFGTYRTPAPSAVNTVSTEEAFRLAPNPSTGATRVEIPTSFSTKEAHLIITDLTGKTIFSQSLNGTASVQISTEGWAKGLYLVRLQNAEGKMLMNKLSVQ